MIPATKIIHGLFSSLDNVRDLIALVTMAIFFNIFDGRIYQLSLETDVEKTQFIPFVAHVCRQNVKYKRTTKKKKKKEYGHKNNFTLE